MNNNTQENLDKLKAKLRELFQLDRGDLDFGLYRIMAMKSEEVSDFLDNHLLPQVTQVLGEIAENDTRELKEKLAKIIADAKKLGFEPDTSPKVQKLKDNLTAAKNDSRTEAETYNHIYTFFSRYYDQGDFMSLRRYKSGGKEAYAIPYNGEEVKLHWANADQYYIKTTENYAAYSFFVDGKRVRFEIAAADNEKDHIKESSDKNRLFVLAKDFLQITDGELVIRFDHRPLNEGEKIRFPKNGNGKQQGINADSEQRICKNIEKQQDWLIALSAGAPTEADGSRTILAKHLADYTVLRRELGIAGGAKKPLPESALRELIQQMLKEA